MRSLVIKCTAGADEPERCSQAFTVAAAAIVSGAQVSLWLTGEAAWFGLPGRAEEFELPLAAPLSEARDLVLAQGSWSVTSLMAPPSPARQRSPRRSLPRAFRRSFTDPHPNNLQRMGAFLRNQDQTQGMIVLVVTTGGGAATS
jgi:hypothetical protein